MNNYTNGLRNIKDKDTIVATYEASDLYTDPERVKETYLVHDATHVEIGKYDDLLDKLVKQVTKNKGAAVGAVIGDYGYGKTSLLVHLWASCQKKGLLAVPPFVWLNLGEFIQGVYGWTRFQLEHHPELKRQVEELYKTISEKKLEYLSKKMKTDPALMQQVLRPSQIASLLELTPNEVLDFLEKISEIVVKEGWSGLIVFTDELQRTVDKYESLPSFFDDLYELANGLVMRDGNYGVVFGIPLNTQAIINDQRFDIVDRLKFYNIYVHCEELYNLDFPSQLWKKYAENYGFRSYDVVAEETLNSIAQICFNKGLGNGPRGVIEAFKRIAEVYMTKGIRYTPLDLVDDFLNSRLISTKDSRLVFSVNNMLQLDKVKSDPNLIKLVKLLAAFPLYGCTEDMIKKYGLCEVFDGFLKEYFGTEIAKLQQGYTLTALIDKKTETEKFYTGLVKNFMQTYAKTKDDIQNSIDAFCAYVLPLIFPEHKNPQSFVGWKMTNMDRLAHGWRLIEEGAFDESYPNRQIIVRITTESKECLNSPPADIDVDMVLNIHFDHSMTPKDHPSVTVTGGIITIRLNPNAVISKKISIRELEIYPASKIDVVFALCLLYVLGDNSEKIPKAEEGSVNLYVTELSEIIAGELFPQSIELPKDYQVKIYGPKMVAELVNTVCARLYPHYKTFFAIKKKTLQYMNLVKDKRVPVTSKMGRKEFTLPFDVLCKLMDTNNRQSLNNRLDTLKQLLEYQSTDGDLYKIRLKLHPLEQSILEILSDGKTKKKNGFEVPYMDISEIKKRLRKTGYVGEEVTQAIELLGARGLVEVVEDVVEKTIENTEDRRQALLDLRSQLEEQIEKVTHSVLDVPSTELPELPDVTDIQKATTTDEFDAFEEKIREVQERLKSRVFEAKGKHIRDIESKLRELANIYSESMPRELETQVRGPEWSSELDSYRLLLKKEFYDTIKKAKDLKIQLERIKDQLTKADDVLKIVSTLDATPSADIRRVFSRHDEFGLHFEDYKKWLSMLDVANDCQGMATRLYNVYGEREYKTELEKIYKEIREALAAEKLSALDDYEIYEKKITELKAKMDAYEKNQRSEFNKRREHIQETLRKIGVSAYMLSSVYDPENPKSSDDNMMTQAREKLSAFLQELLNEMRRNESLLRYAQIVLKKNCESQVKELDDAIERLESLLGEIAHLDLSTDLFSKAETQIRELLDINSNVRKTTQQFIQSGEAVGREKEVLAYFKSDNKPMNLRDLVIEEMIHKKSAFGWDEFIQVILELFKKNLIDVQVHKRR